MGVFKTIALYIPGFPGVPTDAEANSGGGRNNNYQGVSVRRVHLVNVAVDIDCGMPTSSAVDGARNPPHMDIGEQYGSCCIDRERANAQRRSHALSVDNC